LSPPEYAIHIWGTVNATVLDCLVIPEICAMFAKFTSMNKSLKTYASFHLYPGDKKTYINMN